jgi:hypothetical protein
MQCYILYNLFYHGHRTSYSLILRHNRTFFLGHKCHDCLLLLEIFLRLKQVINYLLLPPQSWEIDDNKTKFDYYKQYHLFTKQKDGFVGLLGPIHNLQFFTPTMLQCPRRHHDVLGHSKLWVVDTHTSHKNIF